MTMTKQTHLLGAPPAQPLIAPSILSADFGRLVEDCRDVLDAGADLLHVDVMDGHFVPNLSMGPAVCGSLRRHLPDVYLDVHLMVEDPGMFLEPFVAAGANPYHHASETPVHFDIIQKRQSSRIEFQTPLCTEYYNL